MNDTLPSDYVKLTLLRDKQTPYGFLVQLLEEVFGRSTPDARFIAAMAHRYGEADCGLWPRPVADVLLQVAREKSEGAGHPLAFARTAHDGRAVAGQAVCNFCGKPESHVKLLHRDGDGGICDGCLLRGARHLSSNIGEASFSYAHEILGWHFEAIGQSQIETSLRTFPARMRADLQVAFDEVFAAIAIRQLGIKSGYRYQTVEFADLWETGRSAQTIVPVQYVEIDIGEEMPRRCVGTAIWLLDADGLKHAVLVSQEEGIRGDPQVRVEIAAPLGERGAEIAAEYFRQIERIVDQANSYRGKVLSLDVQDRWHGLSGGVTIHRLPEIQRANVILPDKTLALLDRNVLDFARYRDRLRAIGQPSKKGLLFYGPPGIGKTHTIQYLASSLAGHTTLLVTAEQVALLRDYFSLARLLQPAILVIEDADLIARDHEEMGSASEEALLNKLLNEMDGLRQDADIFFILTTNRPEHLEAALAGRPGRIDQAIEFPLPDAWGREELVRLYCGGLNIADDVLAAIVERTEGVSPAFIKELMRRTSQYVFERGADGDDVLEADVQAALDEMVFDGGKLNVRLLGGPGSE